MIIKERKMKNKLVIGFILVLFLSACTPLNNINSTGGGSNPAKNDQRAMEMTRQYSVMQTIIAREQSTNTPTPNIELQLLAPFTSTNTVTPIPNSAIATALQSITPVYQGPGFNYRIACYVDKGIQLLIAGRNMDSSWFSVKFGQGQTCYRLYRFTVRDDFFPDPAMTFWVSYTGYAISGNLNNVPIKDTSP
jgi:hypothetical protein